MAEKLETMFGDFTIESEESATPDVKTPEQIAQEAEAANEVNPPATDPPAPEVGEDGKPIVKDPPAEAEVESEFDVVVNALEDEGVLYLDPEKSYANTMEGLAEMMRDNATGLRDKVKADFEATLVDDDIPEEIYSTLNPADAKEAEIMVREHLRSTGYTQEEIDEKITDAVTNSTLTKEATIAKRVLVDKETKAIESAKAEKVRKTEDGAKKVTEAIAEIKQTIMDTDEISGFKLDDKTKASFTDYLFKRGADGKTESQRAGTDEERRIRLAFLDFVDYNKADFDIKAKTDASRAFKKSKSRFTDTNAAVKGKSVKETDENEGTIDHDILSNWGVS